MENDKQLTFEEINNRCKVAKLKIREILLEYHITQNMMEDIFDSLLAEFDSYLKCMVEYNYQSS